MESLQKFITEKTGIKPKGSKPAVSYVEILNEKTFNEQVGGDKDLLVAFTAPWCGRKSHSTTNSWLLKILTIC